MTSSSDRPILYVGAAVRRTVFRSVARSAGCGTLRRHMHVVRIPLQGMHWYLVDFGMITPNLRMAKKFSSPEQAKHYADKYGNSYKYEIMEV